MPQTIPLTQGYITLVSDADFPALSEFKWRYAHGYAARTVRCPDGKCTVVYLHRQLLDPPVGFQVDHVNGLALDNRRENLRLATPAENVRNRALSGHSVTGYKGVSAAGTRYHARLKVNYRSISLGYFDDAEMAALIYDAAARRLHREFARLNFPERSILLTIEAELDRVLYAEKTPRPQTLGKSIYRGVYSDRGLWRAKIGVAGHDLHLGYFESEEEAAMCYNEAALLLHGSKAKLNFLAGIDTAAILQ